MKIEISSIVENQLPVYVREEFPLAAEFLKQYYRSDTSTKIVQNLEDYLDLDSFFDYPELTTLVESIDTQDDTIIVSSTKGFPDTFGLLKIDNEIITYQSKTDTTFEGCVRGFSGIDRTDTNQLVFSESSAEIHQSNRPVYNLNTLFLKEFFVKTKQKIAPGFENREFYTGINESNFLKRIKDFYQSKGTEEAFKILFAALYGKDVELILPRDRLLSASNAQYRVIKKLVVEALDGDPKELVNGTIYQDAEGASGTITYVERIVRNNKEYFVISLDFDYDKDIDVTGTVKSDFTIHPQTIVLDDVAAGASFIDVDSTVGFPDSGELEAGGFIIQYQNKTLTQFLNCSDITSPITKDQTIRLNTFAYGYNKNNDLVKVRITGVLQEPEFTDNNYFFNKGDTLEIETLGISAKSLKANNWNFNIPLNYTIESISLEDISSLSYKINTIDDHVFVTGDTCSLVAPDSTKIEASVTSIVNNKSIIVNSFLALNLSTTYTLRKEISKANFDSAPELNIYNTNVQNTYLDRNDNVYVLSSSLPSYLGAQLTSKNGKIVFSGTYNNQIRLVNHPFLTGDSVVYKPFSATNKLINEGVYFIKRVDADTIKLATSKENLFQNNYIQFSGTVTNNTIEFFELTESDLSTKQLQPQNLIRKLTTPEINDTKIETVAGTVGILKNGVEILNYKSQHQIFYGPIESVIVSAPGNGYDIINPQRLTVSDSIGVGATIHANIIGSLQKIDIIDPGFDYVSEPSVTIKGGNGRLATAKANLIEVDHIEFFDSINQVYTNTDSIGFSTYHKFRQVEEVIYNNGGQQTIGGLINNEKYFALAKSPTTISLHTTKQDAVTGINSINLSSVGYGIHSFKATSKKKKIGSFQILNSGEKYEYRKNVIVGINSFNNEIKVPNHNFSSGELVYYTSQNTKTNYYVTVIDGDTVKLSQGDSDFYYRTNQYTIPPFTSASQFLEYPPITVEVKGIIGITTFGNEDYSAKIVPVFRGKFNGVTVENGGKSYGSEDILDYNRQPLITVSSGSGAQIKPVISNGRIISVIVLSQGNNYFAQPDIIISGTGKNAVLTPVIQNGSIVEVKVISSGFGYVDGKTNLIVVDNSAGAKFETTIKSWRINLFERYNLTSNFSADDGVIYNSTNPEFGLQYYHLFAPRQLRKSTYAKRTFNNSLFYEEDLKFNGIETNSTVHSPIIGWAYDGNPIYGPYGYSSNFNANSVSQLRSGYSLKSAAKLTAENRPNSYPVGFFVEDYEFTDSGDLDEHNGRYGATPEFPNGTYAYFASIETQIQSGGLFNNYKKPKFPYLIGNSYYAKPIEFNFDPKSNQNQTNLNTLDVLRNTTPYNLNSDNTHYNGIIEPYKFKSDAITVSATNPAKIDNIQVFNPGDGYKVNEIVELENNNLAKISRVKGKPVVGITSTTYNAENLELLTKNGKVIGYSTVPHSFDNNDYVFFSTYNNTSINDFVKVQRNQLSLSRPVNPVATTGIVTYFNVHGNISEDSILPNDVYQVANEEVKVLNVEVTNSRLRIIRSYNGISGISTYQVGLAVTEKSRKITFDNKANISSDKVNKEYYFNPAESVGVGTVGITTTIYFSNPGIGLTTLSIPLKTIYIPSHNINTNDVLVYNNYGNNPIAISTNGVSSNNLANNSIVYAARVTNDLIGISTIPFVNNVDAQSLYFTYAGNGDYQSFTTKYSVLQADASKQSITVETVVPHQLTLNDEVNLSVLSDSNTAVKFFYSDATRRIVSKKSEIAAVNVENNILSFNAHQFVTGEKVIYETSGQLIVGLQDDNIYYVIAINDRKIKLAASRYNAENNIEINLTSSGNGTVSSVNPLIKLEKNSTLVFDLSDSSLGFSKNGFAYPAFKFNIYYDQKFNNAYYNDAVAPILKVVQSGIIGLNATATLSISDDTPSTLYYNLEPVNSIDTPKVKAEKIQDFEQNNYNTIEIAFSSLNTKHKIKSFTANTFTFDLFKKQYVFNYNTISYDTDSRNVSGGIHAIKLTKNNPNNYSIPNVTKINSSGSGAILKSVSNKIGQIKSINFSDIGFDYSIDSTIKPRLNVPQIVKVHSLYTIDEITTINVPIKYHSKPELILIDDYNNQKVEDLVLSYDKSLESITVLNNAQEIQGTNPYILSTNNSVGIAISSISFNSTNKEVTVVVDAAFSDINDFPFGVGTKVLIENVNVDPDQKGYNSSLYKYKLFEINNVDPNIGGIGASFSYSMSNVLNEGDILGTYNTSSLKGLVVPESYLPKFDVKIKKIQFIPGESIGVGTILEHNLLNEYVKVLTNGELKVGAIIKGQSSKAAATIDEVISFNGSINVNSSSRVISGWMRETGFLNNNLQRIHDNDYYQYFSYSLKSEVDYSTWNQPVSDLAHPAGFKKFSDLVINSQETGETIVDDSSADVVSVAEYDEIIDMNSIDNFDLVRENNFTNDGILSSNQIYFENSVLQDYIESIGNRVIGIDPVEIEFSLNNQISDNVVIDTYNTDSYCFKKYFITVLDKWYPDNSSAVIVTTAQNESVIAISQYAEVSSNKTLGYFDANIIGNNAELRFYPLNYEYSSYYVNSFSYDVGVSTSGISTINLGDGSFISYNSEKHNIGIGTTTIIGISSSVRAGKLLIGIAFTDNSQITLDELSFVHDGNNISFNNYGGMQISSVNSGIGTYNLYYLNDKINVDLIPNYVGIGTEYTTNLIVTGINTSGSTGIGSTAIKNNYINSSYQTSTGITTEVTRYSTENSGCYSVIAIENTTDQDYSIVELVSTYNPITNQVYIVEFGSISTNNPLGSFDATVVSANVIITFTPFTAGSYVIKSVNNVVGFFQEQGTVAINNTFGLSANYQFHEAAIFGIQNNFELKHNNQNIFTQTFNSQSSDYVSLTDDTIRIPNHLFVTGEEVNYQYDVSPIGIGTTTIGIGTTNLLPKTAYIVKVNDLDVKLAATASDALAAVPKTLELRTLGIGSQHSLSSTIQNNRTLICLDNIIQSPLVSLASTTTISNPISYFDSTINVNNPSILMSGDLIKIDNEIMRVLTVGIGSTNTCFVDRSRLGTTLEKHSQNAVVNKIKGNYNIIDNTLYYDPPTYTSDGDYSYTYRFTGRVFLRTGHQNTSNKTYYDNYILDDISSAFNGITKSFTLKSNGSNVTGIEDRNAIVLINNVLQSPENDFNISEITGASNISFTGAATSFSYDVNNASIPRGGIIVAAGSTQGFGYQPLVSAGGTAVVSIAGTIQSVAIGNSGSGYRSGLQTVRVGVKTDSNLFYIGTANVSSGNVVGISITNPGIGFTSTNPPAVVFDPPLSYDNIPLIYAGGSSGAGVEARVSIIVGQGSSVIGYEINNSGYGYKPGEELTVQTGGSVGIPTDSTKTLNPFKIKVEQTFNDDFASWIIGDLQVFDAINQYFDGTRKNFQLRLSNKPISIRKKSGSNFDLNQILLVFINDILQTPGESYNFNGGSIIEFTEAPRSTDTAKIIFYRGTSTIDTLEVDIEELIEPGDTVLINSDKNNYQQTNRLVSDIIATNTLETFPYSDVGISESEDLLRPISLFMQTDDIILNGNVVSKGRISYETQVIPTTNIISNISIGSTQFFTESLRGFFDNKKEYLQTETAHRSIKIISQDDSNLTIEEIKDVQYDGDYGSIVGIKTTTIGIGSTGLIFDFFIPSSSPLRTQNYIDSNVSGIKTGYYFKVSNTNIGNGIVSLEADNTSIGISTMFIDNTYRAYSVSVAQTSVPGIGVTDVARVTAKVDRDVVGTGFSGNYGDFSWGRMHSFVRNKPKTFTINPSGISTAAVVQRIQPLKFDNYYS